MKLTIIIARSEVQGLALGVTEDRTGSLVESLSNQKGELRREVTQYGQAGRK